MLLVEYYILINMILKSEEQLYSN